MADTEPSIFPKTILIVEDEGIISMMVEEFVKDMGADSVLAFRDTASAVEAARVARIDCAILDIHIGGRETYQIASILQERGVPFVFSTGSVIDAIDRRYSAVRVVRKPFTDAELRSGIELAVSDLTAERKSLVPTGRNTV